MTDLQQTKDSLAVIRKECSSILQSSYVITATLKKLGVTNDILKRGDIITSAVYDFLVYQAQWRANEDELSR